MRGSFAMKPSQMSMLKAIYVVTDTRIINFEISSTWAGHFNDYKYDYEISNIQTLTPLLWLLLSLTKYIVA